MANETRVSVLGATGSIGRSTLDIMSNCRVNDRALRAVSLTAKTNVNQLAAAARKLDAEFVAVADDSLYHDLKDALCGPGIDCGAGESGLQEAAARQADVVVSAITGAAALKPTLEAVKQGAQVALANKESLVCAGKLLLDAAKKTNARLLPVDSEHNAIFQVLDRRERVEKLILTASGGPFRTFTREQMENVTPEQAVAHPNWSMGAKISVDSATMMNKGLELIEAAYLFDMDESYIDVLVHPQSIIHSLVAYDDGSVLAQLGMPDMRTPISYALSWPDRMPVPGVERLDLAKIGQLDFSAHDPDRFPAIDIARRALRLGPWGPCVLNAVNEVAVATFLRNELSFFAISEIAADILQRFEAGQEGELYPLDEFDAVFELDARARRVAHSRIAAA